MTRIVQATFRDTVEPAKMNIDATYQGVGVYVNGSYAWPAAQIARFTKAGKYIRRIDVIGDAPHLAGVLDVERGDATPQKARTWSIERHALAGDATIYCSRSVVPAVVEACEGIPIWFWVADWTGEPHIAPLGLIPGTKQALVQYENTPGYDKSAVYSLEWLALGRNR